MKHAVFSVLSEQHFQSKPVLTDTSGLTILIKHLITQGRGMEWGENSNKCSIHVLFHLKNCGRYTRLIQRVVTLIIQALTFIALVL